VRKSAHHIIDLTSKFMRTVNNIVIIIAVATDYVFQMRPAGHVLNCTSIECKHSMNIKLIWPRFASRLPARYKCQRIWSF